MEKKELKIVGLGGPPSTGKTETLDELAKYLNAGKLSYGNIVRAIVVAGKRLGNFETPPCPDSETLKNYYQNIPEHILREIILHLGIRQTGINTDYLFEGEALNGNLKDNDIGLRATYLGTHAMLPQTVNTFLESTINTNGNILLIEGRKDAVKMMDLCGWMACSRREKVRIFREEHRGVDTDDAAILNSLRHRTQLEIQADLLAKPREAIDLIRLNGTSNRRIAQVFGEIIVEARNGKLEELPRSVVIGEEHSRRIPQI